jgi:predicted dehydrogenase/nucleoside-diphosphate-sugar epimerase
MSKEPSTSRRETRVAIFGAGKMAMNHIKAISLQENARLVAIADPAIGLLNTINELPRDIPVFVDPEELLSKTETDIVHICTPPKTHFDLSILALRHKANIYVEKPFTLNVIDAKKVISLGKESGLRICAGHQLLFEGPTLRAKEHMAKIGRIVHVESYFSFNPVRGSMDGKTTMSPLEQLVDILPHPVYLMLHFMKFHSHGNHSESIQIKSVNTNTCGNAHGIFHYRGTTGSLFVTLEGRPIESYIKVIGTNGSIYADFVRGTISIFAGPGVSGISKIINPYSQSWQTASGTTKSLFKRLLKKQKSYPGLFEIIKSFYNSILSGKPFDVSDESILETVTICEEVTNYLRKAETEENALAEADREKKESQLKAADTTRGGVLVTGGAGFLGRAVAAELRKRNWTTRVVSRNIPPSSKKLPGVEYAVADLGGDIPIEVLKDISVVVHCAAETSGGKEAHQRNSIQATRNILISMANAGVKKIVHISSIAVLKTCREIGRPVDENTPFVTDSEGRGPYVWGKVESEKLALNLCKELNIDIRVIRPGALVDYNVFEAPGRLGREVGPFFVCIGGRKSRMGLCDVYKAAEVIRAYVEDFANMPLVLNLNEPEPPTHAELVSRLLKTRPDLKVIYFPTFLLWLMSPGLKLLQKIVRPEYKPIDIYAIFAPEEYNNDLVKKYF